MPESEPEFRFEHAIPERCRQSFGQSFGKVLAKILAKVLRALTFTFSRRPINDELWIPSAKARRNTIQSIMICHKSSKGSIIELVACNQIWYFTVFIKALNIWWYVNTSIIGPILFLWQIMIIWIVFFWALALGSYSGSFIGFQNGGKVGANKTLAKLWPKFWRSVGPKLSQSFGCLKILDSRSPPLSYGAYRLNGTNDQSTPLVSSGKSVILVPVVLSVV
jgi:hypothetical protein